MLLYADVWIYLLLEHQLITQNNDKYYPETLTGKKIMLKSYHWQNQAQQATTAVSVSVC